MLGELVLFATVRVTMVDVILHIIHEIGIRTVHDSDAASGDFAIDSGETAEDDVVEHEEGILTDPVPRGVEVASLEHVEDGLDTVDVGLAVLATDGVETGLKLLCARLLCIVFDLTRTRVPTEVAHVELHLLGGEAVLVSLELEELLRVDDGTTASASTAGSGT